MRIRAAAVVISEGKLLVMHRRRGDRTYAVLPGGGIEEGESVQDAVLRELREETGLRGRPGALLPVRIDADAESPALYLTVHVDGTELQLGGPEQERADPQNVYRPAWVPLAEVDSLDLVPETARAASRSAVVPPFSPAAPTVGDSAADLPEPPHGAPALVLREATAGDSASLWPLASDLATSYEPTWPGFVDGLGGILEDAGATVILAQSGEDVIGYVHVLVHEAFHADGAIGWVEELAVSERWRGHGCGRALMVAAERWARDTADVAYLALATRRAESFYRAIGYEASATYLKKAFR